MHNRNRSRLVLLTIALIGAIVVPIGMRRDRHERHVDRAVERFEAKIAPEVAAAMLSFVDFSDGVSADEAGYLCSAYCKIYIPGKYIVDKPQETVDGWAFRILFIRRERPDTAVLVTRRGFVSADGYAAIDYGSQKRPNKTPEPTTTAVTPRAAER